MFLARDNEHADDQLNAPKGDNLRLRDRSFELTQFHFHHPSEHLVDGKRFGMEAHFVHAAAAGGLADRVAVVDDGLRALAPVDLERGLTCGDSTGNVDGRLLAANRARRVRCIEVAPLFGAGRPLVTPMMAFLSNANRCTQRTQRNAREHLQYLTTTHDRLPASCVCQRRNKRR
ncbi:carbonic anhydrase family protein [Bradyrhizobium sp. McL0615]|uniref:carbonic anhydrase family protein n=1 Tax=Bradyrhizobium sp. McL0615 TaxID=3415673 RepID=UPI003CEF397F